MGLIIAWQLKGKHILVVGGGGVAKGRVESLVTAGVETMTLIAAQIDDELKEFIDTQVKIGLNITIHERNFEKGDLPDNSRYDLVLSAITDRPVSLWIGQQCRTHRIPVNVADIPEYCDFYFGSMINRGPLQIMVSTNGKSPRLARRIRAEIEEKVDDMGVDKAIENMGKLRAMIRIKTENKMDKATIDTRMKWVSELTDKYTFSRMAALSDSDIQQLVDVYPDFSLFTCESESS